MNNTLFAIGEALIDFIPSETGCSFAEVKSFSPKIGGAPANVLGAFAKLGGKTQLITQLGDDPFGHKIADELEKYNIGIKNVKFTNKANTALAFVSLEANGNREFSFYRNPSADMLYSEDNLSGKVFDDCFALHFCSVSLGNFPMKQAHNRAIDIAAESGAIISFDPNVRLPLWNDAQMLKRAIWEFLPKSDIVKLSDNEIKFITGTDDVEKGCKVLLEFCKIVICTCGEKGAYAVTENCEASAPSENVCATDTTGAGDAFVGSFLYNLHRNGFDRERLCSIGKDKLSEFLRTSNRYCAESVQKHGAIDSYPHKLK